MKPSEVAAAAGRAVANVSKAVAESAPAKAIGKVFDPIKRFATLERWLAGLCATSPFIMWLADSRTFRDSVSAYYDMTHSVAFYVPLTIAGMLFLVNGVIKQAHFYNAVLGIAMLGVVIFNHDDFTQLHQGFAVVSFLGNFIVMWRSEGMRKLSRPLVGVAAAGAAAAFFASGKEIFWPEVISLGVIATHFILASSRLPYQDLPGRGEPEKPAPAKTTHRRVVRKKSNATTRTSTRKKPAAATAPKRPKAS